MSDPFVLIVYYSVHGATSAMANEIALGIESITGMQAKVRTVPRVSTEPTEPLKEPNEGPPFATKQELKDCRGLILGSPTRFGNMAAPLKYFIDSTSDIWLSGGLIDKPAGVFTSSSTMHGGQETTLFSMLLPLMHHGAYLVGIPYSSQALNQTTSGGTPYGPSHVAGAKNQQPLTADEKAMCFLLGKRVAELAVKVSGSR